MNPQRQDYIMSHRILSIALIPAVCLSGCGGDTMAPAGGGGGGGGGGAQATTIAELSGNAQIIATGATHYL